MVESTFCAAVVPAVTDDIMAISTMLPEGEITSTSTFVPAVTVSVYFPAASGFVVEFPAFTVSVVKSVIVAACAGLEKNCAKKNDFFSKNFALVLAGKEIVPVIVPVVAEVVVVVVDEPPVVAVLTESLWPLQDDKRNAMRTTHTPLIKNFTVFITSS